MDQITVILTGYKRNYFADQINVIQKQRNVDVSEIFLWQNEGHIDADFLRDLGVKIIKSDYNFKFWGRFCLAFMAQTPYVAIFDDDIIPGCDWLANAIRCCKKYKCITGANGRIYKPNRTWINVADKGFSEEDRLVDFVGHCWVFDVKLLKAFFMERPHTFENGEDMHFGLAAKKYFGIDSYVAKQDSQEVTATVTTYSSDEHATYLNQPTHNSLRFEIFESWIDKGYQSVLNRGKLPYSIDRLISKCKSTFSS